MIVLKVYSDVEDDRLALDKLGLGKILYRVSEWILLIKKLF